MTEMPDLSISTPVFSSLARIGLSLRSPNFTRGLSRGNGAERDCTLPQETEVEQVWQLDGRDRS